MHDDSLHFVVGFLGTFSGNLRPLEVFSHTVWL